ncbi:MAG: phosphotransferase [Bacteroidales bacterium]|nr:phosphotransferase [Bacteroidales bacterium]
MRNQTKENIKRLFKQTFNEYITDYNQLPLSGSSRIYFRIKSKNRSVIGAYNSDKRENEAFLELSEIFKKNKVNVPKIYAEDLKNDIYIQEDLGNETLFNRLLNTRKNNDFPEELIETYKKVTEQLAELQIKTKNQIDFSLCYPRNAFDRQSIMWDFNYFKYNFLKFTDINFDEQLLENDFNNFADYLLQANCNFFMYRDFQSRNIMLHENKIYFIDYQGGRKGALQYDLASLLYDAKADISEKTRNKVKNHYLNFLNEKFSIDTENFDKYYYEYVLIRILQAMGAYGFRGLYEKKSHFIDSIPYGLKNMNEILPKVTFLKNVPELKRILKLLPDSQKLKQIMTENKLKVTIKSFSYKRGTPYDNSGNGGGFVFDCRFINNPGRIERYKQLCGKDKEVIDFLENLNETRAFFNSISQIVSAAVLNYQSRGFKDLAVNFGCTGGQHRSVFFAEKTARLLRENFDINVELIHRELS